METQINALGLNNDPPSEDIKKAIKESLLPKNIQDLNDLDSEIYVLEDGLRVLKSKRDAKEKTVRQLQSIVSPMRSMPPEVLGEIFLRCLPTHRNPIVEARECPLLLTHVCHFWRETAISDTRLWSQIHITFSTRSLSDHRREAPNLRRRSVEILRESLNVFEQWVSRAGERRLSVSLYFWDYEPIGTSVSIHNFLKDLDDVTKEFLEMLVKLLPKIEHLEMELPDHVFHTLQTMLDTAKLTKLTLLKIKISNDFAFGLPQDPLILMKAQNLKEISISMSRCLLSETIRPDSGLTTWMSRDISSWTTVTSFSIHTFLTPEELIFLLRHATNLVHVKAVIAKDLSEEHSSLLHSAEDISLPFLRTLSLEDGVFPHVTQNCGLYKLIHAPELTWLEYSSNHVRRALDLQTTQHWDDGSIVTLLERSSAVKKLTLKSEVRFRNHEEVLEQQRYHREQLKRIFQVVPSITHLVFGDESMAHFNNSGLNSMTTHLGMLALGELASGQGLVPNVDPNWISLLPNLVSLKIFEPSDMDDQDLIKFITSRMEPPSPEGSIGRVTQLRHVGVVFCRPQKVDIAAEIREYAERMGFSEVVPDLWFKYPDPCSFTTHMPGSGVNWGSGTTWPYKDAEEFLSGDL